MPARAFRARSYGGRDGAGIDPFGTSSLAPALCLRKSGIERPLLRKRQEKRRGGESVEGVDALRSSAWRYAQSATVAMAVDTRDRSPMTVKTRPKPPLARSALLRIGPSSAAEPKAVKRIE
eukprot:scaffold9424_cov132-Isochrysis_galbana.AAC.3